MLQTPEDRMQHVGQSTASRWQYILHLTKICPFNILVDLLLLYNGSHILYKRNINLK